MQNLTMRSHTCGELRLSDKGKRVELCGWVHHLRDKGKLFWIDLRDRFGVVQLLLEEKEENSLLLDMARKLGREYVIRAKGEVIERFSKNPKLPTGEIEIQVDEMDILNISKIPPFLIEEETDGKEELRMKYRYLDLRRKKMKEALELRYLLMKAVRAYLDRERFIEIETPMLIKSTPEGARDFLVPSRINKNQFYALPQSPQAFKQLLMIAGFDRYFQIVRCFRDEDLRADRQPEFTQIDCEMTFVTQNDVLATFEGLIRYLFKEIKGIDLVNPFPKMDHAEAIAQYGTDKPHIGLDMKFHTLTREVKKKKFIPFDQAELILGMCVKKHANLSRKQLDGLTRWVECSQIRTNKLVYVKYHSSEKIQSSVNNFFSQEELKKWLIACEAGVGDLLLILCGGFKSTRRMMGELRLEIARRLGLNQKGTYHPLWIINFPLLERNSNSSSTSNQWRSKHHPFTSPLMEDKDKLAIDPQSIRANAYDMVINGIELGGGSIRIHDKILQKKIFKILGISDKESHERFGFLMDAFEYGAPPHGGIAFGFDRICALFGESDSIRDYIAFPKSANGRDIMIDSPAPINNQQWKELGIKKA